MFKAKQMTFDMDASREITFDDDALMMLHVPKKLQGLDLDLFQSKWFDYRRMTSWQATGAYIKAYGKVYRDIYARELDYERAKHVHILTVTELMIGLEKDETKAKRKLSGFWRGRQIADVLGMPYELYIEHAFTNRMRRWQRAYLPQPEHLYHEFDVEKIQEQWEQLQASILYLPDDPAYLAQNYQNIPYQNDFHEWLFRQMDLRGNDPAVIARMIEQDFLPIDKVASRFSPETYSAVESFLQ